MHCTLTSPELSRNTYLVCYIYLYAATLMAKRDYILETDRQTYAGQIYPYVSLCYAMGTYNVQGDNNAAPVQTTW